MVAGEICRVDNTPAGEFRAAAAGITVARGPAVLWGFKRTNGCIIEENMIVMKKPFDAAICCFALSMVVEF